MSKSRRNPIGYWTLNNEFSENHKILCYIFESEFPDFLARRETPTSKMIEHTTAVYNRLTGEDQEVGQIFYQIRLTYSIRLESVPSEDYDKFDTMYKKYRKELR